MSTTRARIQQLQSITGRTRSSLRLTTYVLTIMLKTLRDQVKRLEVQPHHELQLILLQQSSSFIPARVNKQFVFRIAVVFKGSTIVPPPMFVQRNKYAFNLDAGKLQQLY